MRHEDVTFSWSDPEPRRPARAVLVRLVALTDHAYDDGDLTPYLMRPQPDNTWTLTLTLPSELRSSYQFCPVRDGDLAGELERNQLTEESWLRILALGEPDPRRASTFRPGTVYGNPGREPSILELADALPQPWRSPRAGVRQGSVTRYELNHGDGPPSIVHIHRPVTPALGGTAPALLIVFDATFWLSADITPTLDNLVVDRDGPSLTTVMVESIHGASRHEGLTHADLFEPFLVSELLPWLRARWNLGIGPIVLAGQSLGALTVSWAALRHPRLFGHVVTSSMAAWWPGDGRGGLSGAEIVDAYRSADAVPVSFFLEVGSRERELLASVRTFRDVLMQRRYDVWYREYEGGHDLACWRGGMADGLVVLLGHAATGRHHPLDGGPPTIEESANTASRITPGST